MTIAGIGDAASPEFLAGSARAAELAGFATMWMGEHLVLFADYPRSNYPYAGFHGGGEVGVPDPTTPIVDPLIALTWAAAATSRIEVGTGIVILPQRNPLVLAKQLGTLDSYSGGRLVCGVGVGWCREEYEAAGVPWRARGRRMDEYLSALHSLLTDDVSSFHGSTIDFEGAYMYPKPVRVGGMPILIGGESDAALDRAARAGDGWLAYNLPVDAASVRIQQLRARTRRAGRDPDDMRIVVGIFNDTSEADIRRYRDAGVTDLNLVVMPAMAADERRRATMGEVPLTEPGLSDAIAELGARFVGLAESL